MSTAGGWTAITFCSDIGCVIVLDMFINLKTVGRFKNRNDMVEIRGINNRTSNRVLNLLPVLWPIYPVAHKNIPNLHKTAISSQLHNNVVLLNNRIPTTTKIKSNHSWTVPEIMMLYAFVLIVKYAKEYRVSDSLTVWDPYPVTAINNKRSK